MTLEQLISSPEAYMILLLAWVVNWLLKRAARTRPFRRDPHFKLALTILPLAVGAVAGTFLFDSPGATELELAVAGAGAAAPAVVSYSALKQLSALPWLPARVASLLAVLLERSRDLPDEPETGNET